MTTLAAAAATTPRLLRFARIGAVLVVAVGLFVAHRLGALDVVGNPDSLKATLVAMGAWGWIAFVLAYAGLQPWGVPGMAFVLAASLVWPWPVAFALSMVGTMAASVIGFSFARFVARDWVSARIPARFRRYEDAVARRGFITVIALRLVFTTSPPLHAFFGVSKVRFGTHFWASLAAYVVPLFLVSYFGQALFDAARNAPPALWALLAVPAVLVATTVWLLRRSHRAPLSS